MCSAGERRGRLARLPEPLERFAHPLGCGLILFFATTQGVVQLSTEDHNRGSVMGVWSMILTGGVPLGSLLAGLAADRWDEPLVLAAMGAACAGAALGLLLLARVRSTG